MTSIEITQSELIVHVQGLDRIFAFKSELRVPLRHVAGAEPDEAEARKFWHGIRAPGTYLPGVITAGTFYAHEGRVFWDVHDPARAVAIHLHDEKYAKLVIEVEDVGAAIAQIKRAIGAADPDGSPAA